MTKTKIKEKFFKYKNQKNKNINNENISKQKKIILKINEEKQNKKMKQRA